MHFAHYNAQDVNNDTSHSVIHLFLNAADLL